MTNGPLIVQSDKSLLLEVADTSALAVITTVPIDQFAAIRRGVPAQTFDQDIDE